MAPEGRPGRFKAWILEHDDRWTFVVLYTGLAVALSLLVGLFWLLVVVGIHAGMEWYRQRTQSPRGVAGRTLWAVKLDVALILFALAVSVYMDLIIGLAGLGQAARVGARVGSRLAGWQRALRGLLLTADDAAQLGRALVRGTGRQAASGRERSEETGGWSFGDWIALILGAVCLLALLAAPLVLSKSAGEVAANLLRELHPWPRP